MTQKLVMFDVDGTLIDSQDIIVFAMRAALVDMACDVPTRAEILSIVGLSLNRAIAQLCPRFNASEVDEATIRYRSAFIDLRRKMGGEAAAPLYRGARATLEALHKRADVVMGVATGKTRRGLDYVTRAHELDAFFATRQTADGHPSKPHPSMLEAALAETGCMRGSAVMIGDTSFDMDMARAAGVRSIGVAWGYHAADQLLADVVINHFDELIPVLDQIWKN